MVNVDNRKTIDHIDSDNHCDRRTFLRLIGAASLPLAAQACHGEDFADRDEFSQFRGLNPVANVATSVLQAKPNQSIGTRQEQLSLDSALTTYLALGDQCRIQREDGRIALYTVGEIRPEQGNNK